MVFPGASPAAQVISAFAAFAAAFAVRLLGGLVFGPGDRVGRQKVLATTMIMMAVGAFAIGVIPGCHLRPPRPGLAAARARRREESPATSPSPPSAAPLRWSPRRW
ncbi:hypothetical protein GCM10010503_63660 [Streptomyces lucensis JCM 4490]|uniref:Major facilitator superfamily (MFS) profile domain-containing protein n=1 Tax=Streptomyces lucensis JCM 4490 TaxID=1306176 RepID=A0A918JGB0_9ACTN|nr:hypothetical protein GCM10010503_63660 [Streptomyces lucensis JCM 4490]